MCGWSNQGRGSTATDIDQQPCGLTLQLLWLLWLPAGMDEARGTYLLIGFGDL